jgi:hypothetical protein
VPTEFPFVEIPPELEGIVGKRDPGTRMYRRDGSQEESSVWFDLLTEIIGPSVSPGGVGMYCPVSRAAVYKRIKEGKLSIFLFHVTHRTTTLFGKNRILRDNPYGYIPASEARAWREELERRALSQGTITEEELEGARPDWSGEFLEWREKRLRGAPLSADGFTKMEVARALVQVLLPKRLRQPAFLPKRRKGTRDER